jgi:lipopolysaccharide transport system permease protein
VNAPRETLVIEAGRAERHYWKDLWRFRELFFILTWRDILVRYKQTAIGIAWALLRPLFTVAVFTVVFGRLAKLPSDGVPYPLLVAVAVLPWQFFASGLNEASNSLISNAGMISKVYFPRLIIPASAVIVSLVDLAISSVLVIGLMIWYGFAPDWRVLTLPFFVMLAFAAAFGGGLWFAALNVKYRDFRYLVPFVLQLGLYISPVAFSSSILPQEWRLLYSLNPMAGAIDGVRWAVLAGAAPLYWPGVLISVALSTALLAGGIRFFRGTERRFADVI